MRTSPRLRDYSDFAFKLDDLYNARIGGALTYAFIVGACYKNLVQSMEGQSDDFKVGGFHIEIYCVLHIDNYFTNIEVAVARHMVM